MARRLIRGMNISRRANIKKTNKILIELGISPTSAAAESVKRNIIGSKPLTSLTTSKRLTSLLKRVRKNPKAINLIIGRGAKIKGVTKMAPLKIAMTRTAQDFYNENKPELESLYEKTKPKTLRRKEGKDKIFNDWLEEKIN